MQIHFVIKVKGKAEASPAPSKNSACIPMDFWWTEAYKDSLDKLKTEQRHIWLLAVYLLWKRVTDIYITELVKLFLTSTFKYGTYAKYFCGFSQTITQ